MSAEKQLFDCLGKILKLQKSLFQIAKKKTDIIKADDIDALGQLLKDELKHVKAIEMLDKERENVQLQLGSHSSVHITISDLLQSSSLNDKEGLKVLQHQLVEQTQKLKEVNELNQQLLQQSLNYINLNLDLLLGQQESSNYTDNNSNKEEGTSRSLFDSRA
ncbi:flagellar protein FlgN [Metabacillus schmidteae]|uniref:flagellar protein FlgN n=1 Tax=Metabacillus schmidteae TaxID=2730405 RepID=UPI001589FE1B|nr:flagellar protein FlgN [Metabacillus schmidteae]